MDYIVGFIFGFILKELFNLLKYINTSETFIIDNNWMRNGIGCQDQRTYHK